MRGLGRAVAVADDVAGRHAGCLDRGDRWKGATEMRFDSVDYCSSGIVEERTVSRWLLQFLLASKELRRESRGCGNAR